MWIMHSWADSEGGHGVRIPPILSLPFRHSIVYTYYCCGHYTDLNNRTERSSRLLHMGHAFMCGFREGHGVWIPPILFHPFKHSTYYSCGHSTDPHNRTERSNRLLHMDHAFMGGFRGGMASGSLPSPPLPWTFTSGNRFFQ